MYIFFKVPFNMYIKYIILYIIFILYFIKNIHWLEFEFLKRKMFYKNVEVELM